MVGAVDQRHPGAEVTGVAAFCLVERLADDVSGVVDDAGHDPFVGRDRPSGDLSSFVVAVSEDVGDAADHGRDVVDRGYLGDSFAVAFLAFGK